MLVISTSFAVLSFLLLGDLGGILANAKPPHSPLERRMNKHRRRADLEVSPSPPPVPLVPREESDDNVVWVDVTSTTTVTPSASKAKETSSSGKDDSENPPAVVGAILAGQDGDSSPNVVYVDVTSTIIKTVQQGAPQPTHQQQTQQNKAPPTTTITATRSKAPVTVANVAISTGKGVTTTIQDTTTGTGVAMSTASAGPINNDDPAVQARWVALHNKARARYGAPPLQWKPELMGLAKEMANNCNKTHMVAAENLQWGSGTGTPEGALQGWVDKEESNMTEKLNFHRNPKSKSDQYDWNHPEYQDGYGHFTQVVWKDTQYVACFIATCKRNTVVGPQYDQSFQTACEYEPAGNYIGEENFRANVLPPGTPIQY
ncbi:hypothetical protein I302_101027 [Kwoniella bestiolae CBS 10118]|uniref:SCP domain-containing protein n=1 Tax=Kwoniella bestiolae CBS 10118 TaxID=1296100 RepID=A0A1B9G6S3_9TREE|nr:hypothetical protein I302_04403 [Kwoniella bestiolae CBS 10118]OCF26716.1 hypothetical protein I302_04403 [Kwoniella bestiolae CBS 10118]